MDPEPLSRPLLVLDLDEALWLGQEDPGAPAGVRFRLRPHLGTFLERALQSYDLAVWTAATEDWMMAGLAAINEATGIDVASRAFFLWHRTRCTPTRNEWGELEWHKPARKFKARWIQRRYPQGRILVIDDRASNYATGYGHLVKVSEWQGDPQDEELLLLAEYLTLIAGVPNFRCLEKRGWRSQVKARL
ncbi:HAD family hydrolase [Deinococcus sonorensis]|uniref:HAD family hydrolase n=2 Tax=Deinococcus sonorensis TaxID=309891 RepID=A0AAU7UCH4_9DEIO